MKLIKNYDNYSCEIRLPADTNCYKFSDGHYLCVVPVTDNGYDLMAVLQAFSSFCVGCHKYLISELLSDIIISYDENEIITDFHNVSVCPNGCDLTNLWAGIYCPATLSDEEKLKRLQLLRASSYAYDKEISLFYEPMKICKITGVDIESGVMYVEMEYRPNKHIKKLDIVTELNRPFIKDVLDQHFSINNNDVVVRSENVPEKWDVSINNDLNNYYEQK